MHLDAGEVAPQGGLERGGGHRAPHRQDAARNQPAAQQGQPFGAVEHGVGGGHRPLRAIVDVQADGVEAVGSLGQPGGEVGVDDAGARVRSRRARSRTEPGRVPADDRLLHLDDGDLGHLGMPERFLQREADAQAAEQDPHARPTAGVQRGAHQQALGGALAGVQQEHAVVDDLVVRPGPPQHQLAPRRHHPLNHVRHGGSPRPVPPRRRFSAIGRSPRGRPGGLWSTAGARWRPGPPGPARRPAGGGGGCRGGRRRSRR